MGEFIKAFAEPLRSRLLSYAKKFGDGDGTANVANINSYPMTIDLGQRDKILSLLIDAESASLSEDYRSTDLTREVEEVISCFLDISPTPD